jgi:hypothetical protein
MNDEAKNVMLERAQLDLQAIQDLKDSVSFQYFVRRLTEKIHARELKALSEDTSAEETTIEKRIIHALRTDALNLLSTDEQGCVNLLRQQAD